MKASELRIGNWIVWEFSQEELQATDTDISNCIKDENRYSPIPLTEEWHNKFGVQKNGFGNLEYDICPFGNKSRVFVFSGDYLYIRDMSGKNRNEDDLITIWNKDIKRNFYVHEWQNLYFALSGKELKRKKKIK